MSATRIFEGALEVVQAAFDARMAPEDVLEWDMNLTPVLAGGCDCDDSEPGMEMAVAFYASLQSESGTNSEAHILMAIHTTHSTEDLIAWVDDLWDRLVLHRMALAMESEPTA